MREILVKKLRNAIAEIKKQRDEQKAVNVLGNETFMSLKREYEAIQTLKQCVKELQHDAYRELPLNFRGTVINELKRIKEQYQ